jgi:hypothetical protein
MLIDLYGCVTKVGEGDIILLQRYTICWDHLGKVYLDNKEGQGKSRILISVEG